MEISLAPDILFYVFGFPITNALITTLVVTLILYIVAIFLRARLKLTPGGLQNLVEALLEGGLSFTESVTNSRKKAEKVFPLVFTMFIFILIANFLTFIPGQSAITVNTGEASATITRAAASDYALVFVLTMISVITTQIVALIVSGPLGYIGKFINIRGIKEFIFLLTKGKFKIGVLMQGLLDFFLGLMDIVGEVAKIFSLSFRLFGNIFAGEVLAAVMFFLANKFLPSFLYFLPPLPFMFLGLLTAAVQAFVFAMLTLVFISMASEKSEA